MYPNKSFLVLDSIKKCGAEHSVILTYSCDLLFYEMVILPTLRSAGSFNNMIFADMKRMSEALHYHGGELTQVGISYLACPTALTGSEAFHPKVILLCNSNQGKLIVGSGNCTISGYGTAWELFSEFEYKKDNNPYNFSLIWSLIREVSRESGNVVRRQIARLESAAPWLAEGGDPEVYPKVVIGTPGRPSILSQLQRELDGGRVQDILIVAPFFDSGLKAISQLKKLFDPKALRLIVQSETVSLPGKELSKFSNLVVFGFEVDQSTRKHSAVYMHAKLLVIRTSKREYCLWGSPNCSLKALGNPKGQNIEVAVLESGPIGYFVPKLGLQPSLQNRLSKSSSISLSISPKEQSEATKYRLLSAEYSNEMLHLSLSEPLLQVGHQIMVRAKQGDQFRALGKLIVDDDHDCYLECKNLDSAKCTLVQLFCELRGKLLALSNWVPVHFVNQISRNTSKLRLDLIEAFKRLQEDPYTEKEIIEKIGELLTSGLESIFMRQSPGSTGSRLKGTIRQKSGNPESENQTYDLVPPEYFDSARQDFYDRTSIISDELIDLIQGISRFLREGLSPEKTPDYLEEAGAYRMDIDEDSFQEEHEERETPRYPKPETLKSEQLLAAYRGLTKSLMKRYAVMQNTRIHAAGTELILLYAVLCLLFYKRKGPIIIEYGELLEEVCMNLLQCIAALLSAPKIIRNDTGPLLTPDLIDHSDTRSKEVLSITVIVLCGLVEFHLQTFENDSEDCRYPEDWMYFYSEMVAIRAFAFLESLTLLPSDPFSDGKYYSEFSWPSYDQKQRLQKIFVSLHRQSGILLKIEKSLEGVKASQLHDLSANQLRTVEQGDWVFTSSTAASQVIESSGSSVKVLKIGQADTKNMSTIVSVDYILLLDELTGSSLFSELKAKRKHTIFFSE